jgi:hypothetical protein
VAGRRFVTAEHGGNGSSGGVTLIAPRATASRVAGRDRQPGRPAKLAAQAPDGAWSPTHVTAEGGRTPTRRRADRLTGGLPASGHPAGHGHRGRRRGLPCSTTSRSARTARASPGPVDPGPAPESPSGSSWVAARFGLTRHPRRTGKSTCSGRWPRATRPTSG